MAVTFTGADAQFEQRLFNVSSANEVSGDPNGAVGTGWDWFLVRTAAGDLGIEPVVGMSIIEGGSVLTDDVGDVVYAGGGDDRVQFLTEENWRIAMTRNGAAKWTCIVVLAWLMTGCSTMASAQEVQADECEPEPLPRSVAGDFELLKGRGVAVCEVYLKNLNAIGRYNIDYRRVVPEKFPEISIPNFGPRHHGFEPEWPLLRKVRDYLWERDANPAGRVVATEWPIWQGTPEQLARASQSFMFDFEERIDDYGYWIVSLDIDNDGELDRVFFDNDPSWGIGGTILLVLEDEDDEIDVETTERILKHPSWRASGLPPVRPLWPGEPGAPGIDVQPTEDARLGANYDIFLFEGKTYVDHWWWVHPEYSVFESLERGRVRVFLTERDASEEVCTARVKPRVLGICE